MNRSMLIFIGLILVLAVIFCWISAGAQEEGQEQEGSVDLKSQTNEGIRDFLTQDFKRDEILGISGALNQCRILNNIVVMRDEATCTLRLATSTRWTRRLTLDLAGGSQVELILAQKDSINLEERLSSGNAAIDFDVFSQADETVAVMRLRNCQGAGDPSVCLIEMVNLKQDDGS